MELVGPSQHPRQDFGGPHRCEYAGFRGLIAIAWRPAMNFISALLRALFSGVARLPTVLRWTASAIASVLGRRIPQLLWVRRRIALSDAASITLEEARLCRSILADAAERLGPEKSPDAVLDYIATYIASGASSSPRPRSN